MSGTAQSVKDTAVKGSSVRQAIIELQKVITDLEKARVGSAEFFGSATFDAANLADGAGATTTVTVTGAALGDFVTGVSFGVDLQGITVTAYVSAADTVAIRLQNETTGAIDLASTTVRVRVSSHDAYTGAASDMTAAQVKDQNGTVITA